MGAKISQALGTLTLVLCFPAKTQADPQTQWTWRFPDPQGYTLAAVTYGGGIFVAVGDHGTIITSSDGYHWVNRSAGVFPFLHGVAYADGEYAAVGDGGAILVSSNAEAWTQAPSVTSATLWSIAGNPFWRSSGSNQFLAVGDSGVVVACSYATNWSVPSSGTSNDLYAVTYRPGRYIAVGSAGTVTMLTTSGFAQYWSGTANSLYAVASASANNLIVGAAGDLTSPSPYTYNGPYVNAILNSSDRGANWASQSWVIDSYANTNLWYLSEFFILNGMAFGSSGFVAVGYTGYELKYHPGVVMVSITGTNWTELGSSISENPLNGVTYGNNLYVAVGDFGSIVVSTNAVNWTEIIPDRRGYITAMACNSSLCIAASSWVWYSWGFPDFRTLVSTNGINWAVSTAARNLPLITDLDCSGQIFAGVGGNSIYSTTDGYNWQTNGSFTNVLHGVKYLNGQFITVGDNGGIYSSTDGTNWSDVSVATAGSLNGIAYGKGVYVAAGTIGATSADGVTWTPTPTNPPLTITRMVFGRGLFLAAAYSNNIQYYYPAGQLLTSQDGASWQIQYAEPHGEAFSGLAYSGGTFLALSGLSGAIYRSSDGLTWTPTGASMPRSTYYPDGWTYYEPALGLFAYYRAIYPACYTSLSTYNGLFYMAGAEGMLLQSGNTWSPASLGPSHTSSKGFTCSYNQQIDVPYHIQASTNLVNWENIFAGIGSGQTTNFTVQTSANVSARFFRIVSP